MILVTGANGVVGKPLCDRLLADDVPFRTVSRSGGNSIQWDLQSAASRNVITQLAGVDTLIHCAPVWLLPRHLLDLYSSGIRRFVVFSSTSVVGKRHTMDPDEQHLVESLDAAESALQDFSSNHQIALTVLRPSMIYGYGRDQNIMQIAGFIRRFGFMVLVGKADGLRQPVHADDLVDAALAVIEKQQTFGKFYDLAGAEKLSYRAMVERVFAGLGKKTRVLSLPMPVYRFALLLAAKLTRFSYTAEMANRMRQNLDYDYSCATGDFAYRPQRFLQNPERDLRLSP